MLRCYLKGRAGDMCASTVLCMWVEKLRGLRDVIFLDFLLFLNFLCFDNAMVLSSQTSL